jgi:hypothetical protein
MPQIQIQGLVEDDSRRTIWLDATTLAMLMMSYPHAELHGGNRYYVCYSVLSLGAMTTPDDAITLTFTTPDTLKWSHFTFLASGTGGWRLQLIEAPTGAGITPTGKMPALNRQRNSAKTSGVLALDSAPGEISYDATLVTGGLSLWSEYLAGGNKLAGMIGSGREEIILKQNTKYQLSLTGGDTDPGTLYTDWYEHTNKK